MSSVSLLAPHTTRADSRKTEALVALALLLLALLPYANTLRNGFVYDDFPQLVENPYVRNFHHLREIFTTTVWSFQGAQGVTNYYRPLMTLGYLLCYQAFGPLPFGFHLANISLHAAVVLLLFFLTRRMLGDARLAFVAAALFALHPVHAESVAWVAGVTDIELTYSYLLTFYLFLGLERKPGAPAIGSLAALSACFLLTLFSKEQALTLPALATLYEHVYRADRAVTPLRVKLTRYGLLWLLAAGYLIFRARVLGGVAPVLQRPGLTWSGAIVSVFALVAQYTWKLLWPVHLSAFYVFRKSSLADPHVWAGLAIVLLSLWLFLKLWCEAKLLSFALLWMAFTLVPVLNARWMAANVFAERYLYLPSVGFCWLVAWLGTLAWNARTPSPAQRRAAAAVLCVVGALYATRTIARNLDWRSDEILMLRTLESSPDANLIRANLGAIYWNRGDVAAAEREWLAALAVGPNNVVTLNNLGLLRTHQKRYQESLGFFQRAIRQRPDYMLAHLNLGDAYLQMGRIDDAEREFRLSVRLSPLNVVARNRLGKYFFDTGRWAEAQEQYESSLEVAPTTEACDRLGDLHERHGEADRAARLFEQAAALDRFDSHAHFGLGRIYAGQGRTADAIREHEAGLVTDPNNAEALAALEKLRAGRSR